VVQKTLLGDTKSNLYEALLHFRSSKDIIDALFQHQLQQIAICAELRWMHA